MGCLMKSRSGFGPGSGLHGIRDHQLLYGVRKGAIFFRQISGANRAQRLLIWWEKITANYLALLQLQFALNTWRIAGARVGSALMDAAEFMGIPCQEVRPNVYSIKLVAQTRTKLFHEIASWDRVYNCKRVAVTFG